MRWKHDAERGDETACLVRRTRCFPAAWLMATCSCQTLTLRGASGSDSDLANGRINY